MLLKNCLGGLDSLPEQTRTWHELAYQCTSQGTTGTSITTNISSFISLTLLQMVLQLFTSPPQKTHKNTTFSVTIGPSLWPFLTRNPLDGIVSMGVAVISWHVNRINMKNLYHLPTHNPCEDFISWWAHSSPSRGRKSVFKPAAGPVSQAVFRETLGNDPQRKFLKCIWKDFRPGVDLSRHPFFQNSSMHALNTVWVPYKSDKWYSSIKDFLIGYSIGRQRRKPRRQLWD